MHVMIDITDRCPSISGVSAVNPLVAFYNIHGRKEEVYFLFCLGHHTSAYDNYHIDTGFDGQCHLRKELNKLTFFL
jgi:hypothetical protein